MTVTLDLPDDIARMLGSPEDVSRRALESFGLEEFGQPAHPTRAASRSRSLPDSDRADLVVASAVWNHLYFRDCS